MNIYSEHIFKTNIKNALKLMRDNPDILEAPNLSTLIKLTESMKSSGQGSANGVTKHEANIAHVFELHGFSLAPRTSLPTVDGYYYKYQANGSQQKGDFILFWYVDGDIQSSIIVDAKHSNSKSIYLNDGWFDDDTVYVISYNAGTKRFPNHSCFVGLGQNIPTEAERSEMDELVEFKKIKNKETKNVGFLRTYIRFANQYSCKRFNSEFTHEQFEKTLAWLEP